MSRFYVGQRVRVVRGYTGDPQFIDRRLPRASVGHTGTVAGTESRPNRGFRLIGDSNVSVLMDGYPHPAMAPDYCLEPVLPEGHQRSEFKTLRDLLESLAVTA